MALLGGIRGLLTLLEELAKILVMLILFGCSLRMRSLVMKI